MICKCGHTKRDHNAQGSRKGFSWDACSIIIVNERSREMEGCFCYKFIADNLKYLEMKAAGEI